MGKVRAPLFRRAAHLLLGQEVSKTQGLVADTALKILVAQNEAALTNEGRRHGAVPKIVEIQAMPRVSRRVRPRWM